MMITVSQLKEIMRFQLANFNDEGVTISDSTIHKEVLDEDDGFGHVNSVQIYKDVTRFVLIKQGHRLKKWPTDWLDMTIENLAEQII